MSASPPVVSGRRRSREMEPDPDDPNVAVDANGFRFRRVVTRVEMVVEGLTYDVETTSYEELSDEEYCRRMYALLRDYRREEEEEAAAAEDNTSRGCKRARLSASDDAVRGLPEARAGGAGECAVCLQDFGAEDTLRAMPCAHAFHQDCILRWLRVNHVCPLCRHALPTQQDEDDEEDDDDSDEDDDDSDEDDD
ncbi:hypothetical protein BS78_K062900 [Paspalum vaginatum]|uniref:RING-type domain-containing protein n=1 Tax=Paspalum vaginatum TaxID=158149 RepID=A0A9W7X8R6_9POAL|nr:hypothetical protein BS78_K062900 [Paspalum vaginatum]